jgi:tRNA A-37 threonylcarbamoyl transferase component Bud32/tetratricopeptide (TPR) repeat protein
MDGTPALLSGTFATRYTVERELGRGASATVYLARDTQRGRAVAIKVLRPELAESLGADRFLREIKVNEKLHHPHIASVLDSGEHDGRLFFVLPHMEGGSLRQMLQREKQLPIEAAIAIARTVAEALDYAHKQGLIHRDVKPENILFTSGQACLVDFGIARAIERAIDESTTETGLVRGTPAYMSPEQASGSRNYDGRSDQYSLACVLYEMLAGMPAFAGPTPEAVIAMRFKHAPRELRVFRSSVSPAIEAVIQKALSITVADRYATAGEFSSALDAAMRAPHIEPRTSGPSVWNTPSRKWALAGAAVFVVALAAAASIGGRAIWGARVPPLDTTKYFVFPIEGDASAPRSQTYDLMLQSLGRWKGVTVVDRFTARNALGSDTAVVNDRQALKAARGTGAGRYVRSRLTRSSTGLRLYGALFDASEGARLHEASLALPVDLGGADSILATLAKQLLLRGSSVPVSASIVLPAMQFYQAAATAREAFNLRLADSLLLLALDADHDFALASLRLAEIRSWRELPTASWLSWAERANAGKQLTAQERELAGALFAMGRGDYERACPAYRKLTRQNPQDFAMWYGRATCLRADKIVLRDARSPSGWRFRTSYQEAVNSYVRAFELAPALHRTFQAGAYDRLRTLLFAGPLILRDGAARAPDTIRFYAYPAWKSDSLLFIPYPRWMIPRGLVPHDLNEWQAAAAHEREVFRRIARSWATALPNNAATKEAVAISLDMVGDPAALDTIRSARALAEDPLHALRLAAEEIFMLVGRGRWNGRQLQNAKRAADSLINTARPTTPAEFVILAPIASLVGRCRLAGHFAAQAADLRSSTVLGVPHFAFAAAESLTVVAAVGCDAPADAEGLRSIEAAVSAGTQNRTITEQEMLKYTLLARNVRLATHPDSSRLVRFAVASGDVMVAARVDLLASRTANVRALLEMKRRSRGPGGTSEISPDAVFQEANLWAALGDSSSAVEWLDASLHRATWLELLVDKPVETGALMRAIALRATLASAVRDKVAEKEWRPFVTTLWSDADPELRRIALGSSK